jgi:heterodisulfide reductase subunit B
MSDYIYYPGCSLEQNAKSYHDSLTFVCEKLGIGLQEVDDWNCCGATEYVGINLTPAYSLITRNLALAAKQANGTNTVVAPCSACYLNLSKADHYMREQPKLGVEVNEALEAGGLSYKPGSLDIRHLLDVLIYDVGLDAIKSKVVKPLSGLRVAPYLGCMVPRPNHDKRWSDSEKPVELDLLLEILGAEVVDFPLKSNCCGGHMPHISPETAYELIHRLLGSADEHQTDIMATLCPMCQMNVDAYQDETNRHFGTNYKMPIIFFTQLVGLAFGGKPEELGFGSELVSAKKAIAKIGTAIPGMRKNPRGRKKNPGLPVPEPLPTGIKVNDEEVI